MPNINYLVIAGHIGKAPDLSKKPYRLSVATTVGYESNKRTLWHDITVWDDNALIDADKGDEAYIIGHIDYTQKEEKRYMNIVADAVQTKKKKSKSTSSQENSWEKE